MLEASACGGLCALEITIVELGGEIILVDVSEGWCSDY